MKTFRAFISIALLTGAAAAVGHPHRTHNGQIVANGQLHPKFMPVAGADTTQATFLVESCDTAGTAGPAWYGLETAHHGPDMGAPGKGDNCYVTLGRLNTSVPEGHPARFLPVTSGNQGFE